MGIWGLRGRPVCVWGLGCRGKGVRRKGEPGIEGCWVSATHVSGERGVAANGNGFVRQHIDVRIYARLRAYMEFSGPLQLMSPIFFSVHKAII